MDRRSWDLTLMLIDSTNVSIDKLSGTGHRFRECWCNYCVTSSMARTESIKTKIVIYVSSRIRNLVMG